MRYFRYYPWGLQLLLFILMAFTLSSFSFWCLNMLLPKITGYSVVTIASAGVGSPYALIRASMIFQGIASAFFFLIPSLLFAYFTHPRAMPYLGFNTAKKPLHYLLAPLIMLGCIPFLTLLQSLMSLIDFGAAVKATQLQNEKLTQAFTTTHTIPELLFALFIMAVLPAIGEELFFRGVLFRFAARVRGNIWFAAFISAAFFAAFHSNVYGLPSIFIAGMLLGGLYYFTGTIWTSIIAHFCFNGSQIVLAYVGQNNPAVKTFLENSTVPFWLVASGAVVAGALIYLLLQSRAPLPAGWTKDFDEPETTDDETNSDSGDPVPFKEAL